MTSLIMTTITVSANSAKTAGTDDDKIDNNNIQRRNHNNDNDSDNDDDDDDDDLDNNNNKKNNNLNNNHFLKLDLIDKSMLFFAGSSIFLFGGAYYGWGPMQLLLEENGNFHSKCAASKEEEEVCELQTQALLNVRFYSQLTLFTSPILGYISDQYGSTTICGMMSLFAVVGIILLIISTASSSSNDNNLDWLLYVSFSCIGIASIGYGMMTVETGIVFNGKHNLRLRSRIISAMNALYDSGAITYWILWFVGEVLPSTTLSQLASGYLIVAILCLGGYWYLFRKVVIRRQENNNNNNNIEEKGFQDNKNATSTTDKVKRGKLVHSKTATTTKEFDISSSIRSDIVVDNNVKKNGETTTKIVVPSVEEDPTITPLPPEHIQESLSGDLDNNDYTINDSKFLLPAIISEEEGNVIAVADTTATSATTSTNNNNSKPSNNYTNTNDGSRYIKIADRPFKDQIKSSLFLLLATFFSFHQTSNIWTLTTARDFLKYLGDDETGNKYLTIFTLLTPVSLLGLPFVDIAIHKYGFHTALQCINVLAIAHGTIKVSSQTLNVQIVGFVIFSFFRCFLFSVSLSCLPTFVSSDSTGRAVSILYCVSGALCFLNIPFARLALESGDGNFFLPNLLYLIMTLPMIAVTWQLGKKLKLDYDAQQPEETTTTTVSSKRD